MRDIDVLLREVRLHAPKVGDLIAYRYIREAAREICQASKLWRENDQFEISTPECEAITTIQNAAIVEVEWAQLEGINLTPVTVAWLGENLPHWTDTTDSATARYITSLNWSTVTVVPKASGLLKCRFVLQPSREAEQVPDFLVDDFAEEIGKGAAAKILMLKDETVSDPDRGVVLQAEFNRIINVTKRRGAKGQQGAPLRTRPRFL